MIEKMKKNKLLVLIIFIYVGLLIVNQEKAILSFKNSSYYIKEMLIIMPVVFLLTSLIEAWVPRGMIMKALGEQSGMKGAFISLGLGSISAGPIYAAFPVCKALLKKGASVFNIIIILSSWAVIKIPMLANEAKFLSPKFMMTRWILTTIGIIGMGYIISKIVKKDDIPLDTIQLEKDEVVIQQEICIGCGICVKEAPDYFKMENKKAIVTIEKVKKEDKEIVKVVKEKCPVHAIDIG